MPTRKSLAERFEENYVPEPNCGCWIWIGACSKAGYGNIRDFYAQKKAHRVGYELYKGPIPEGLFLDHKCRNPRCVNPDHLEPVTPKENTRRGLGGVLKTHCKKGHPLSGENLYMWRGLRHCRSCRADRWLRVPSRFARRPLICQPVAQNVLKCEPVR